MLELHNRRNELITLCAHHLRAVCARRNPSIRGFFGNSLVLAFHALPAAVRINTNGTEASAASVKLELKVEKKNNNTRLYEKSGTCVADAMRSMCFIINESAH